MLGANLGVIIGILFLAVEISQNTTNTRAQLLDQIQARIIENNNIHLREDPAPIVEKSVLDPDSLTFSEFRIMDSYLLNAINIMESYRLLSSSALIGQNEWKISVNQNASWYFGNPYAMNWWEKVGKTVVTPELSAELDTAISSLDGTETWQFYLDSKLSTD